MNIKKILYWLWIAITPSYAMLSDGLHPPEDYVLFVETQEAFKSCCFIYDHARHILQTGVLIEPDIVMTAAHGFEGKVHLDNIIVGFGETVTLEHEHNYEVKAMRTHPRFYHTPYPAQAKYDMLFFKLKQPVKGIQPVPLFDEKVLNIIPPLYVATFGSADVPDGAPVQRRAFVLPETDVFSVMGRDPEALYDYKTVMMGSIFFEPMLTLKPVHVHGPEKELRTYHANKVWNELGNPPFALTLAGSSGAPVFITMQENGISKTYVFGIIQSFSHLSGSAFHHSDKDRETHRLLKVARSKIYGRYQSVFCIPYKLHQPLQAYKNPPKTYRLSRHVKAILTDLKGEHHPNPPVSVKRKPTILYHHPNHPLRHKKS
jgi:hypothetical protein